MLQGCAHQLAATGLQLCEEAALLEQPEAINLQSILNAVVELL